MNADVLIVGAGFCGATLAEQIASQLDKTVIIIDKRGHIGGNAYDTYDAHGILIHQYGPHIFHTDQETVFRYLSRFTAWRPYEHRVLSSVHGKLLPFPINRTTLNTLYALNLQNEEETRAYLDKVRLPIAMPANAEEKVLSLVGRPLYELFFKEYTRKQWGIDPTALRPSVTARIPIRFNEDCRYFTDRYQVLPQNGYTPLFQKMLDHPKITVLCNTPFEKMSREITFDRLIYTGSIDSYFNHCYGPLPYRAMRFEHVHHQKNQHQEAATINYPDNRPCTRSTEFKQMTGQECAGTTICYEYPKHCHFDEEKHYPIPTQDNEELYKKYAQKAKKLTHVVFCGRLGDYKYYNMDHAVMRALTLFQHLCRKKFF